MIDMDLWPQRSLQSRVRRLDNARYHGGARAMSAIDTIVMHATAGESAESSIGWLNRTNKDGSAIEPANRASYHYLIDRNGAILRTLPVTTIAYHAGYSGWPNPPKWPKPANAPAVSVNTHSVGIAWANRDNGEPLTPEQIRSALWLCGVYCRDESVSVERVLGHYEVSPGRKVDPKLAMLMSAWRESLAAYLAAYPAR